MDPIEITKCPICNTVILIERDKRFVEGPEYAQLELVLSNDSLMTVALCRTCAGNPTKANMDKLIGRIKSTWFGQMVGWATDKQFTKMQKIEIVDHAENREKAIEKYQAYRTEKLKVKPKKEIVK